ncbi:acetyl-CoA carboxylase biotin carboxyl carrier protein [Micromonospora costi]|uniref:Biotin carboxyl carrier protein of acetyl-CoA carboxylase n=1 Tax=Micromonospora costi TaxID=1530042 RepID=A0A3A9ZWB8_9ACTN|nr:acetyl-CoA carboxylase biotin carboxyl carrier protein [Micromonospora costi]RKN52583.1 acetyl-CoA carboxylase biotin carboxyl carrier protein [Micromonospora costi]
MSAGTTRPETARPPTGADGDADDAGGRAGTDAVLTGLRRHARQLVAELAGPVRRVRLRSGDTVLEVEWHDGAASAPTSDPTPEPPARRHPAAPADTTGGRDAAGPADATVVRSPIVGTFYRASEPGAVPFVTVGDLVRPGQVVGIVEAMKLMNEVTADRGGRVAAVLADDGQPVEYDQPLVALDPA